MFPGNPRNLTYPMDRSVVLENEVPDEAISGMPVFPADPDERTIVLMELSLNEFVTLASSVDAGRDIAFPDFSQYVWWLWCKAVNAMSFCEKMIDCIENDADTIAAINALLLEQIAENTALQEALQNLYTPTSTTNPIPAAVAAGNLMPETGCDENETWGSIENLIENMNINNQDMQQIIESAGNVGERVAKLISGIPVIGLLPFDEAIDYAQTLLTNDVFEAYLAADTTAYRNEIKADLFCLSMDNSCELSLDDVGNYFAGRLSTFWTDTFTDVLLFLAAGIWTGTEINDTFYYLQVQALAKSNAFFGMLGLPNFAVYMRTGIASDGWITIADCPGTWSHRFDFTIDAQGWSASSIYGAYVTSTGWVVGVGTGLIWLERTWTGANDITAVRFEVSGGDTRLHQVGTPNGSLTYFEQGSTVSDDPDYITVLTGNAGFSGIQQITSRVSQDGGTPYTGTLIALTLYGVGTEPTW